MSYYFLREDFSALERRIKFFEQRLEGSLQEMGEGVKDDPNAWHDNFGFEEGQRQATIWSTRLRDLIAIKNQVQIISPSSQTEEVAVGSIVTVQYEDGSQDTFRIGSYWVPQNETDEEEDENGAEAGRNTDSISYNSPLAQAIIGGKIGDKKSLAVGGRERSVRIIGIML